MHDLLLVGGGLANALIAHRLSHTHPELRILVIEAGERLGGNHTWSFHASDLTPAQLVWMESFITHRWAEHEVRFPAYRRRLASPYLSIASEQLHARLSNQANLTLRLQSPVKALTNQGVELDSGERIEAACVIDGRGQTASPHLSLGYQKFLGIEVELASPHGLACPIIMDATLPQLDGYRFIYTLPFSPTRLLIEDTRYSDGAVLEEDALRAEALAYAKSQGWQVRHILREERGILPIALGGDIDRFWREPVRLLPCSGLRAGLFHATTGYSLPEAVQLADRLAALPHFDTASLHATIRHHARIQWRRQGFYRLLNRMLFRAALPGMRYRVLERFYRLPLPLILRFYAGRSNGWDKLRILSGKPPVPLLRALRSMRDSSSSRKA